MPAPGDPWRLVQPGDPFQPSAEVWNELLRLGRGLSLDVNGAGGSRSFRQNGIIQVRNDTGSPVSRFGVLKLNGPVITNDDDLEEFQNVVLMKGITPTATTDNVAILIDPADTDAFSRAAIDGIVQVQIDVTDTTHGFANPIVSDNSKLRSGATGLHRILWKESGTGTKWALVRVGDGSGSAGGSHTLLDGSTHTDTVSASSAKGAMIAGSGAAPSKWNGLSVGSDRYVLQANTGASLGVEWTGIEAARINNAADQTIGDNTDTQFDGDTEVFEGTDVRADSVGEIAFTFTGIYLINFNVEWEADATVSAGDYRQIRITVDTGTEVEQARVTDAAVEAVIQGQSLTWLGQITPSGNNVVRGYVRQVSGASLDVLSARSHLTVAYLGRL